MSALASWKRRCSRRRRSENKPENRSSLGERVRALNETTCTSLCSASSVASGKVLATGTAIAGKDETHSQNPRPSAAGEGTEHPASSQCTLCYAIMLPGRKSACRAGKPIPGPEALKYTPFVTQGKPSRSRVPGILRSGARLCPAPGVPGVQENPGPEYGFEEKKLPRMG